MLYCGLRPASGPIVSFASWKVLLCRPISTLPVAGSELPHRNYKAIHDCLQPILDIEAYRHDLAMNLGQLPPVLCLQVTLGLPSLVTTCWLPLWLWHWKSLKCVSWPNIYNDSVDAARFGCGELLEINRMGWGRWETWVCLVVFTKLMLIQHWHQYQAFHHIAQYPENTSASNHSPQVHRSLRATKERLQSKLWLTAHYPKFPMPSWVATAIQVSYSLQGRADLPGA